MSTTNPTGGELIPFPVARTIPILRVTSKSRAKALACPNFFAKQYSQQESIAQTEPHYLTKTGLEFHRYRQQYATHLQATNRWRDEQWRQDYLRTERLSPDARKVIEGDSDFSVDPQSIFGCEAFLVIDHDFRALGEIEYGRQPGLLSDDPNALCSGQLDLILLVNEGRKAIIRDPKSGWSTVGVTDEEPPIYASLIFAHFPMVREVEFVWDFVRAEGIKRNTYTRDDLPWMHQMIAEIVDKQITYAEAHNRGETLPANPFSGLCPHCQITCPMRPRWDSGELAIGPVQTKADYQKAAMLKKVCDDVSRRLGQLMLGYMDVNGATQEVAPGWIAEARTITKTEYPLVDVLEALGLRIVDETGTPVTRTRDYDVPLRSLGISGLSDFAKAKKRAGLKELLTPVTRQSSYTRLYIRKGEQTRELVELLQASVDQLADEDS